MSQTPFWTPITPKTGALFHADSHLWSVVVLHVRRAGSSWSVANPDEVLDVTESLALANERALYDVDDWGCTEAQTLPRRAADAAVGKSKVDARLSRIATS